MRRLLHLIVVTAVAAAAAVAAPPAGGRSGPAPDGLDMFRLTAPAAVVGQLVRAGYDVAATRPAPQGLEADLVLSPAEANGLAAAGLPLVRWRDPGGRTVAELSRPVAASGRYTVWRSYDEPGGIRDEIAGLARTYPDLVQARVIGHSGEGREILALRVTGGAAGVADGTRPAVLHVSVQHAREWISVEVNRRLLRSYVESYGTDPEVTALLDSRELWFVLVANPDGYERSFLTDRLWRKTTRDNDGDGRVGTADGVDLNRNLPDHWGFDPEGSSARPDSQSYRGPAPASEPETQALVGLMERVPFAFLVNYHSFGRLLLYPFGWQDQTPAADQPVYAALAGTVANPAIPGYRPQLSTELYVTNGETTSWAHAARGAISFTPELGEGVPGSGFLFPDNEALIQQEYEINRPFALDLARSAADPSRPRSHLGHVAPTFVVDSFPVSYGAPQPVQATVPRRLGDVGLHWRVNDGPVVAVPTAEWDGGERFGADGDVHYRAVRGEVTGTAPGDRVEVWFEAGGQRSDPFTYRVEPHSAARVLVVSGGEHSARAGSLTPESPGGAVAPPAPDRLTPVVRALAANGVAADVYDVEAHDQLAPHPLGVLGHYDAVVWTTDAFRMGALPLRTGPRTVSRLANEEILAIRAYLNEGGRLLYMGRSAGGPYAEGAEYDPSGKRPCNPDRGEDGCVALSDDFFQYWLGAYEHVDGGGSGYDAGVARVDGVTIPFEALSWRFAGPVAAPGGSAASFSPASEALDPALYPHLTGRGSARYRRSAPVVGLTAGPPGGPDPAAASAQDAAVVATPATLLFGFGFEDVSGAPARAEVLGRAIRYLLPGLALPD